jgi:hypothetical protein
MKAFLSVYIEDRDHKATNKLRYMGDAFLHPVAVNRVCKWVLSEDDMTCCEMISDAEATIRHCTCSGRASVSELQGTHHQPRLACITAIAQHATNTTPSPVLDILTFATASLTPNESHTGTVQVGAAGPCEQTTAPHIVARLSPRSPHRTLFAQHGFFFWSGPEPAEEPAGTGT